MSGVFIGWQQTAEERYDTDVNQIARALIEEVGQIVEHEGGCWLLTEVEDDPALPGEENYMVDDVNVLRLRLLRERLTAILGNPETLRIEAEGKTGVNIA